MSICSIDWIPFQIWDISFQRICIFQKRCGSLLKNMHSLQILMPEIGVFPKLTHSTFFFWQSYLYYVKLSQFPYVLANILSVFHMPLYIPSLSWNVSCQGEIFPLFLGLLLGIHLLILDSLAQIPGVMRRQSWKIPNNTLFYLLFSVNILTDLEKSDE